MAVVIYGAGGHGQDIAATVDDPRFIDDDPEKLAPALPLPGAPIILAVNDPKKRAALYRRLRGVDREQVNNWIHPTATLGVDITLGVDVHIGANTFLTRCFVGSHTTIGPGATICGDVTVGDEVMIGAGAVVKNLITIGDGATIGCGAVVVKDVDPGAIVAGNPARPL